MEQTSSASRRTAAGAFGMGHERRAGEFAADAHDAGVGEFHMGVTTALPQGHFSPGLLHDPGPEVLVGHKEKVALRRAGADDFDGVAAGADDVAVGLDLRAAINICDGIEIGIGLLQGPEFWGRAAFLQRATGVRVRQDDDFAGVEDFGGFGHEMDAAEDDHIGLGFGGLLGEAERIADEIGDVLNFGNLIIMGKDERVKLSFQAENFAREGVPPRWRRGTRVTNSRSAPVCAVSIMPLK